MHRFVVFGAFKSRTLLLPTQISYRALHIKTATTPNPHSMKFMPGQDVLGDQYVGMYFDLFDPRTQQQSENRVSVARSPLAKMLFQIDGIKAIFLGKDFITVTKAEEYSWHDLKHKIYSKIFEFFSTGRPIVIDEDNRPKQQNDMEVLDTDDDIVAAIKELLETRIRPSVQEDGGEIFFEGFDHKSGTVRVRLAGSCVGCPSSSVTLKQGVEKMLKHYIPEVLEVENVSECEKNGNESNESN